MLSDRLGRKRVLIIAALPFMISAILTAVPKELWLFVMARLIGGVAIGLSSPVAPMYIAEMAPEKSRVALVTINQLAITFGIVVAYFCDWSIAGLGSENAGRHGSIACSASNTYNECQQSHGLSAMSTRRVPLPACPAEPVYTCRGEEATG